MIMMMIAICLPIIIMIIMVTMTKGHGNDDCLFFLVLFVTLSLCHTLSSSHSLTLSIPVTSVSLCVLFFLSNFLFNYNKFHTLSLSLSQQRAFLTVNKLPLQRLRFLALPLCLFLSY